MTVNLRPNKSTYRPKCNAGNVYFKRALNGLSILVVVAASACSQNDKTPTTADRVKLVEEVQRTDPNFHLPKPTKVPAGDKSKQVAADTSPENERTADAGKSDGTAAVSVR